MHVMPAKGLQQKNMAMSGHFWSEMWVEYVIPVCDFMTWGKLSTDSPCVLLYRDQMETGVSIIQSSTKWLCIWGELEFTCVLKLAIGVCAIHWEFSNGKGLCSVWMVFTNNGGLPTLVFLWVCIFINELQDSYSLKIFFGTDGHRVPLCYPGCIILSVSN